MRDRGRGERERGRLRENKKIKRGRETHRNQGDKKISLKKNQFITNFGSLVIVL